MVSDLILFSTLASCDNSFRAGELWRSVAQTHHPFPIHPLQSLRSSAGGAIIFKAEVHFGILLVILLNTITIKNPLF
jgi:hypothetical protein